MTTSILHRNNPQTLPKTVLVAGASGGIGQAICQQLAAQNPPIKLIRLARQLDKCVPLAVATQDISFDLLDEASMQAAVQQLPFGAEIDWVFIATGWLHDGFYQPEKSYKQLNTAALQQAFQVNCIGPALLVKQLLQQLNPKYPTKFGLLSARVGSISDNRLGGWHSYRASKAALNMLIKNFAIELKRMKQPSLIVGLQPGTTATDLSAPFQRNVATEHLQSTAYTASQLIKVMQALHLDDSGLLFDFLGECFEP